MAIQNLEATKLSIDGHIATITFNRPERLNAVNEDLTRDFYRALDEITDNDNVWVVILTGEGRGFCAGADINNMRSRAEGDGAGTARQEREAEDSMMSRFSRASHAMRLRQLPQPVIGAINGVAVGMGLSMALACDMREASDQARFGSLFIKRSIMPDTGATFLLPAQVGPGIAAEMTLTGNLYDANWALEKGLVNKVVPHDKLMEEAMAYAETIAANPPIGVRLTKRLLYKTNLAGLQQAIDNETNYNNQVFQTEDHKEAVLAFLEKRQPAFKGR